MPQLCCYCVSLIDCRSASGQDLTGHHKLDRSISGPLSMTGTSSGGGSKQQAPEDLAGAAIEPEDEEGLSAAEVCKPIRALQHVDLQQL